MRLLHRRPLRVFVFSFAAAGLMGLGLTSALSAREDAGTAKGDAKVDAKGDAAAKYSIKDVMKKGYKGNTALVKKVIDGKGSKDDVHLLVELNKALAANKPKKGDLTSWTEKTDALVKAAEAVDKGDKSGLPALKAAANCKACHTQHRED